MSDNKESVSNTGTSVPTDVEEFVLRRKGDAPLRFRGQEIGKGEVEKVDNDYYRRATVYRTVGGNYVAESVFDASFLEVVARDACRAKTAAEIVAWLREEDGTLGDAESAALRQAARSDPAFAEAYGEDVP